MDLRIGFSPTFSPIIDHPTFFFITLIYIFYLEKARQRVADIGPADLTWSHSFPQLLRNELQRAEGELEDRCWAPPPGLQHWLQLTHEIENKAYVKKKLMAEKQLQQAREAVSRKRGRKLILKGTAKPA